MKKLILTLIMGSLFIPAAAQADCRTVSCWERAYARLSPGVKAKLARVRYCESTNRFYARNGPYMSLYQYDALTWRVVGGRRGVYSSSRSEQHVRTARYTSRHGWARWPVCGRR